MAGPRFLAHILHRCWGLLALLLLSDGRLFASDWPQWRGPTRDGRVSDTRLPANWLGGDLRVRWRIPLGDGYSTPLVVGDRVFTFGREENQEVVQSHELASGRVLWRVAYPAPYEVRRIAGAHGAGPRATPIVHDGRLFSFGINEVLHAIDVSDGRVAWRVDFPRRFGTEPPGYGASSSPLVVGRDVVVAAADRLMALDRSSGSIVWQSLNDSFYSSTILAPIGGEDQLIGFARYRLVGLAPKNGQTEWSLPYPSMWGSNVITPTVWKDRVIVSSPSQGTRAMRLTKRDGRWRASPAWQTGQFRAYLTSPVVHSGYLYGLSESGRLYCLDLEDGRTVWSNGNFSDYGTLVIAGDQLLILSGYGELTAVRASPHGYEQLGQRDVADSPTWAHLVLAQGKMFVRDKGHLTCFDLPVEE